MKEIHFRTILFPTDFSEISDYACDYAVSMAEKFNARLYLLHVVDESVDVTGFYLPHFSIEADETNMVKAAGKMLHRQVNLKLGKFKNFEEVVVEGIPHKEIKKFVEEKGIDLLIMGAESKKGIEHFIFGSIAEKVFKSVSCPVLAIKPPAEIVEFATY